MAEGDRISLFGSSDSSSSRSEGTGWSSTGKAILIGGTVLAAACIFDFSKGVYDGL